MCKYSRYGCAHRDSFKDRQGSVQPEPVSDVGARPSLSVSPPRKQDGFVCKLVNVKVGDLWVILTSEYLYHCLCRNENDLEEEIP